MNPTNYGCPSDISRYISTDYRPSKTLYVPVKNNQNFRLFLQRNGNKVQNYLFDEYKRKMNCACEPDCIQCDKYIVPFDSSKVDSRSWKNLNQSNDFHQNVAFIPQVNDKMYGIAQSSHVQKPYPKQPNQSFKCPLQNPIRQ